jgi:hypothetical protein
MPAAPSLGLRRTAVAALGAGLLGLYLVASFGLSGQAKILRLNSSIFDLDVGRSVTDWTTNRAGHRTHVHPLVKLFVAPFGTALRFGAGLSDLAAARWIAALGMTLNVLLVGRLAVRLSGGAAWPGILAALVCGASFSSVLLASIPDTASLSGLGTVVPLLYLNRRWGSRFGWGEALVWSLIGVLCIAFTVSQIANWGIALAVRALPRGGGPTAAGASRIGAKLLAAVAAFAALTWGAASLQAALYPGTGRFYRNRSPARELRSFHRLESVREAPVRHTLRLAGHFAGVNFVAPFPGYADFVIERWHQPYWSLSLEEARFERWHPAQIALFGVWLFALLPGALLWGRGDRRMLAPLLCVASQFALHFVYGREYILYSPNWHGAVTAVLVAAAWNGLGEGRRWMPPVALAFSLALAVNSLAVMQRVYREVEIGLEQPLRDASGNPLPAPPARPSPRGGSPGSGGPLL